MSIVLQGSTSGSITLQEPAVAGSTTINLPATSGTALVAPTALTVPNTTGTVMVSGNMPAFSAYQGSAQSFATSTETKIQYNTEEFDTANCYDPTTNYRFTPNVAGYYFVTASIGFALSSVTCGIKIFKNGSNLAIGQTANNTGIVVATATCILYLNGTTDYVEAYGRQDAGGTQNNYNLGSLANFQACLIRAA